MVDMNFKVILYKSSLHYQYVDHSMYKSSLHDKQILCSLVLSFNIIQV